MRKFILSLVTFASGLIGLAICISSGSLVESIYIRTSITDSVETYTYTYSPAAVIGLIIFVPITILGFIFSISSINKTDK